jgi:hypothetical protein
MVCTYRRIRCRCTSYFTIQAYSLIAIGRTSILASPPKVPEKKPRYRETILDSSSDNLAEVTYDNADKSKSANQFLFYNKDNFPYIFLAL